MNERKRKRESLCLDLTSILVGLAVVGAVGVLIGCDDSNPSASKARPSAGFITDVQFTGFSFIASFTNQSFDSKGNPASATTALDYSWTFQGKGTSTQPTPLDREWRLAELGLISGVAGGATRIVSLTVTEDRDIEKRADFSETLLFQITEDGMVVASVFNGEFNSANEITGDPVMTSEWR